MDSYVVALNLVMLIVLAIGVGFGVFVERIARAYRERDLD